MKQHKNELDVDFIGGAGPLTKDEEKAISEFIAASKERQQKQALRRKARTANRRWLMHNYLLKSFLFLLLFVFELTIFGKQDLFAAVYKVVYSTIDQKQKNKGFFQPFSMPLLLFFFFAAATSLIF